MKKIFALLLLILTFFLFFGCGTNDAHIHSFENGECKECGYICPHLDIEDGKCVECGMDEVDFCDHIFDHGVCGMCGYECPHEGVECTKRCSLCHMMINHEFVDGKCIRCNMKEEDYCRHHLVDGKCIYCGYECPHEGVTCNQTCPVCYFKITHKYVEGKCINCGKEMKYEASTLPNQFNEACPNQGTVEMTVFQSYNYETNSPYENTFFVYLPYGYYDSEEEYNVMYLLHGSGENAAYWLAQLSYKGGYTEQTKVVLDNLHYYGICEKTIVVTPTSNLNGTKNFYKELVNNIMPLAESKYRTKAHLYGKDVSSIKSEDFIASRDYRAYAGLSRGSMIGWTVMAYDLPYFSYYGYYSGGTYGLDYALEELKVSLGKEDNPYDIKYAYHSCGDDDHMYSNHLSDYKTVIKYSNGKLVDEENCIFLTKPGFQHRYNSWILDLYNSLAFAFFKYNEESVDS